MVLILIELNIILKDTYDIILHEYICFKDINKKQTSDIRKFLYNNYKYNFTYKFQVIEEGIFKVGYTQKLNKNNSNVNQTPLVEMSEEKLDGIHIFLIT